MTSVSIDTVKIKDRVGADICGVPNAFISNGRVYNLILINYLSYKGIDGWFIFLNQSLF